MNRPECIERIEEALERSLDRWRKCEPEAMAKQSEVAIMYAFKDAKKDIATMTALVEKLSLDAARYEHILDAEVEATRKYIPINATEFKAKRRAAHDAAIASQSKGRT
jgi:hypothetical protein